MLLVCNIVCVVFLFMVNIVRLAVVKLLSFMLVCIVYSPGARLSVVFVLQFFSF